MSSRPSPMQGARDLRIDWLRGLAMTCVVVNHSRLSSLLSWFSYQRFWVVTAAEVFVVLSGVVLGTVYGRRLDRDGLLPVAKGLCRRAIFLYAAFVAVTMSVLALSLLGVDTSSLTTLDDQGIAWFLEPRAMDVAMWRDVALMRHGPWTFEIIGLYVFLVLAALPCLIAFRRAGWRLTLAASWAIYAFYQVWPHELTSAGFETVFPISAWQLLFVHGIAVGYYRDAIARSAAEWPRRVPVIACVGVAAFMLFALSNPRADGPSWLRSSIVSPELFTYLYERYFALSALGIGRLVNLAVALPLAYALLTWCWPIARASQAVFVTLGEQSLGAFVLHVYGLILLANVPRPDAVWANTTAQVILILSIAAVLNWKKRLGARQQRAPQVAPVPAWATS
ncbi:MAG: OpgC domain-containing protein [Acidobacteriota bacterium]